MKIFMFKEKNNILKLNDNKIILYCNCIIINQWQIYFEYKLISIVKIMLILISL